MREIFNFFNCNLDIDEILLYVEKDYRTSQLNELLDRTNLKKVTLTGRITKEFADELVKPFSNIVEYVDLETLKEKHIKFNTVVFEDVVDGTELYDLLEFNPVNFVGSMFAKTISSFSVWEKYRKISEHILIVTHPDKNMQQVLDWTKTDNPIELSVIFPVYNVAKYLNQCIESVTAWKADYVEFLFVNDGSPDNSRDIILEASKKDSRIKLLDKPNGGCASARQYGLERAKGTYIGFIDPDDYIDESMFRKLLRAAMVGSFEISYCGYNNYYENNGKSERVIDTLGWPYNTGVYFPKEIFPLIVFQRIAIWRGIYKRELIDRAKIHFYTDLRRFDDLPFKVEVYANAKSVISTEEYLYYYRLERPGQDVSVDDQRLYVHFDIFNYLNKSIASLNNQRLTDCLQLVKIQSHRWAISKLKKEYLKEYMAKAREDFKTTGTFFRTFLMAKKEIGKRAALYYVGVMTNSMLLIDYLNKHEDK